MVNGHYIHFSKNKYNKLTAIVLIHLFRPPHASRCELMEQPAMLPTTDYIYSYCYHLLVPPARLQSYRVLVLELQAR